MPSLREKAVDVVINSFNEMALISITGAPNLLRQYALKVSLSVIVDILAPRIRNFTYI